MPIKRILMLIIAALCLFGAGAIAHADEPLEAVCAFTPADFLEPCAAKLSVTVHNSSDKRIESARISHDPNKESAVIGTIEPGETMHFAYDVQVTKKMLEAGKVNLTISYKIGNKTQKLQTSAIVTQVEHLAKAQLTARIFKSAVYPGEIVQVEYRLVNTGEIAIENAVISDAAFSFASEAFSLAPEEEKCINYMTTFSESAISAPRANFVSSLSQSPYVVHAPSAAIHVTNDSLSFSIEPETVMVAYGERAHFSITVRNNGLLTYNNLSLSGSGLGLIKTDNTTLRPQETFVVQVETPPVTGENTYPITLSLREAGATEREFNVGEMKVFVLDAPARNPILIVSANEQGDVPFSIHISGANRNLKNVRLSEKRLGEIKTFLTLEANSETAFNPILSANKGEAYEFMLKWEENGETFSVSAAPAISRITYVMEAKGSLTEASHASLYAIVNATKLPNLALTACIILIALIIMFVIIYQIVKVKKHRRQTRDAVGRTSKFAPVRTRDTEKENP